MKRKRALTVVLALAVAVPLSLWILTRRTVPIEFIGVRPTGDFVFKEDTRGKPLLDFTLPGGNRIQYPMKHPIANPVIDPDLICGYLRWNEDWKPSGLARREDESNPAYAENASPFVKPGSAITPATILFALPYALDPRRRIAAINVGARSHKMKLPLATGLGPSIRKTSVVKAGPFTVTAKPRPWLLSTSPIMFDVSVRSEPHAVTLLDIGGSPEIVGDSLTSQHRPSSVLFHHVIDKNGSVPLAVRIAPDSKVHGYVYATTSEPLILKAERSARRLILKMPDGRIVYGPGRRSFYVLNLGAIRIGKHLWDEYSPIDLSWIKDGAAVPAVAYRRGKAYDFSFLADIPIRRPIVTDWTAGWNPDIYWQVD